MEIDKLIESVKFDEKGLVPVVAQDITTRRVLMVAYMNKEALAKTIKEKTAYYYSRSRQKLWKKGETSGNVQTVKGFYLDCDNDTVLLLVDQKGAACHTGSYSCFFNEVIKDEYENKEVLNELYSLIENRRNNPVEGSYTNYLFTKGLDKILKKVGEETSEVIIGAKNKSKDELVYEISDLVYHLLVLMVNEDVKIDDIKNELLSRRK